MRWKRDETVEATDSTGKDDRGQVMRVQPVWKVSAVGHDQVGSGVSGKNGRGVKRGGREFRVKRDEVGEPWRGVY